MKTFNKKTLCAALAGLGVLGLAGAAQAVSLNPDGLGQVLIYPYYTVRADADGNAFNAMFSVVNTTGEAKAVKVRFLEGKASHEVLDFNLYMSAHDVWTGWVAPTADGAALGTKDNSCTYGNVAAGQPVPFSNALFSDTLADGEDATLDRTREGYAEVIEMAVVTGNTATAITHDANGVPADCSVIVDGGDTMAAQPAFAGDLATPTGGLFGNMTLINVNTARAAGFDAVALAGFYDGTDHWTAADVGAARVPATLWFPSGNMNPNLSMAFPPESYVFDANAVKGLTFGFDNWDHEMDPATGTVVLRSVYTPGLDAVTSTIMRSAIYNEFMNSDMVAGATDWVITMPTKGLYYNRGAAAAANTLVPRPIAGNVLNNPFTSVFKKGGAPAILPLVNYYNREEAGKTVTRGSGFSPVVPGAPTQASLDWEATVVNFGSTNRTVFGSTNWNNIATQFDAGWAMLSTVARDATGAPVAAGSPKVADAATTFYGFPVVGFAVELYNNGTVAGATGTVWASYAATVPHRFDRFIP